MATCIVCNTYFEHGAWCPRCETNNRTWQTWRRHAWVEREGLRGILAFTEPHFHVPLLVTGLATVFGLLFVFTLWTNIRPGFRALVWLVTPAGCLLSLQGIYEARFQIRESEMLRQVRRGWHQGISAQMITLFLPAMAMGGVLALALLLVKIDVFWELVKWLALTNAPETGESLPEKFLAVLPFVSLVGYVALAISFTASSSLMLARNYINQLNDFLPQPIFLQEDLLTKVVRREAARVVCRPTRPDRGGSDEEESRNWIWDEMARTDDGGVRLKAIVQVENRADESPIGKWTEKVTYVVKADPWSRITAVSREGD